jgi:hypothetical protein
VTKTRTEIDEIVLGLAEKPADPVTDEVIWILQSIMGQDESDMMSVNGQEAVLWDSAGGKFGEDDEIRQNVISAAPIARKLLGL